MFKWHEAHAAANSCASMPKREMFFCEISVSLLFNPLILRA